MGRWVADDSQNAGPEEEIRSTDMASSLGSKNTRLWMQGKKLSQKMNSSPVQVMENEEEEEDNPSIGL